MKTKGPKITPVHERVLQRTHIPLDKKQCWVWQGPVNNAGYGMIKGDNSLGDAKMVTVHRVMAREKGLVIKDNEVQHTCLNKRCVNPDHLQLGNPKSRTRRIISKHGRNFMKPKNPYVTCEHCQGTAHVVWFSRKHGDCYPGMVTKYTNFSCKKV